MDQLLTDGQIRDELEALDAKTSEQVRIIDAVWGSEDEAKAASAYDDEARRYLRDLTRCRREMSELRMIMDRRKQFVG